MKNKMAENPYESPHEKCGVAKTEVKEVKHVISKEKGRATTLGCFLGGCLFPLAFPFLLALVSLAISLFSNRHVEGPEYPDGPLAIFGLIFYWIILFPIGAIIGGFVESIVRRPRRRKRRKPSKPSIYPLDK